ncbi:MAG TPA: VOC family protein [Anaerolineales bacterium]|nr:VOC family protein [Anaerolineales bacterium]
MKYQGFVWAGLFVEDLEASITFYRDVLGLPFLGKGEDWAHLDAGNGALLELFSGGKASSQTKTPIQQSLVLGLRVDDLDRAIGELQQRGVRFTGEIGEHEGTRWIHFSDPEGNRLEIKEV